DALFQRSPRGDGALRGDVLLRPAPLMIPRPGAEPYGNTHAEPGAPAREIPAPHLAEGVAKAPVQVEPVGQSRERIDEVTSGPGKSVPSERAPHVQRGEHVPPCAALPRVGRGQIPLRALELTTLSQRPGHQRLLRLDGEIVRGLVDRFVAARVPGRALAHERSELI